MMCGSGFEGRQVQFAVFQRDGAGGRVGDDPRDDAVEIGQAFVKNRHSAP